MGNDETNYSIATEQSHEGEEQKVRLLRNWNSSCFKLKISDDNDITKLEKFSQDSFSDKIYPLHEFDIIDLETSEDGQDEWQTLDGKIDIEDEFYNHLDLIEEDENYEHSDLEFDEYVQDILGFEETHSNSFFESTPIDIDEDIPF